MATKLGSSGLLEADLIIPQGTTFACAIEHMDSEGHGIDHTGCTAYMRIIDKTKEEHDVGEYITFDGDEVLLELPPEVTNGIAIGSGRYDIMIEGPTGEVVRLLYGSVNVVDTYAMDE